MKSVFPALALGVVFVAISTVRGDDQPDKASVWMKQKLAASRNILEGLTKPDFESIAANANSMIAVGYLEKWARADTPGYQFLMSEFEQANKTLVSAARDRNLDKATLGYLQLTVSCVNCHALIRD